MSYLYSHENKLAYSSLIITGHYDYNPGWLVLCAQSQFHVINLHRSYVSSRIKRQATGQLYFNATSRIPLLFHKLRTWLIALLWSSLVRQVMFHTMRTWLIALLWSSLVRQVMLHTMRTWLIALLWSSLVRQVMFHTMRTWLRCVLGWLLCYDQAWLDRWCSIRCVPGYDAYLADCSVMIKPG